MGAAATTMGPAGGAGLIITLMTSSETLAAWRPLRPLTLVSNCRVPPALAARILAMMTSSERPRPTMSMTSWLVILMESCWLHAVEERRRNRTVAKIVWRLMRPLPLCLRLRPYLRPLNAVSYTHLRAHETDSYLVCRLL